MMPRPACLFFAVFFLAACGDTPVTQVKVVTFNMYVGLELEDKVTQLAQGADPNQVAGEILAGFRAANPEGRVANAARQLAALAPDFIALQEAVSFTVSPFYAIDFISALVEGIQEAGGPAYAVLSVDNLSLDENIDSGGISVLSGHFKDREAILYRREFSIQGQAIQKQLAAHRDPIAYSGKQLIFYRSLLGARFAAGGRQPVTLFTTHLDQANLGTVQLDQAQEVLATIQPYLSDENFILVGDFNSSEGETAYAAVAAAGLTDTFRWLNPADTGFTCCSASDLSNLDPIATSRIDLIFFKSAAWQPTASQVILDTKDPLWPSDHFGVLTTFDSLAAKSD